MLTRLGFAVALFAAVALAQAPPMVAGHWQGSLQTPNGDMAIEIDLENDKDKGWIGTLSIPAQNTRGLALSAVTVKDVAVSFEVKAPGAPRFEASVKEGKMTGNVTQGGNTMPFQLSRAGDAKIEKFAAIPVLSDALVGTWEGALAVNDRSLRLRLVLSNKNGAGEGVMFSLDQGSSEIPVARITENGAKVKIELPVISGAFEAERKDNQLTGTWTQGPGSLPLTLTKAAK